MVSVITLLLLLFAIRSEAGYVTLKVQTPNGTAMGGVAYEIQEQLYAGYEWELAFWGTTDENGLSQEHYLSETSHAYR